MTEFDSDSDESLDGSSASPEDAENSEILNPKRFEKISELVKAFKISCRYGRRYPFLDIISNGIHKQTQRTIQLPRNPISELHGLARDPHSKHLRHDHRSRSQRP